jgi:hypothetical protein
MAHLTRPRPELSLFVAAYLLYDGARWASASRLPIARAHADQIIRLSTPQAHRP